MKIAPHDPLARVADAVGAVVLAEEVLDHLAVVAVDPLHPQRDVRQHLALVAEDRLGEVLVVEVGVGRLGGAAEDGGGAPEVGLGVGVGGGRAGAVVEDARLPLEGERADHQVHGDLFVVAPPGAVDLGPPRGAGVPDEAEARRDVLGEVDLLRPLGVEDLLAVPAHAEVERQVGEGGPAVLEVGGGVLVLGGGGELRHRRVGEGRVGVVQ